MNAVMGCAYKMLWELLKKPQIVENLEEVEKLDQRKTVQNNPPQVFVYLKNWEMFRAQVDLL